MSKTYSYCATINDEILKYAEEHEETEYKNDGVLIRTYMSMLETYKPYDIGDDAIIKKY